MAFKINRTLELTSGVFLPAGAIVTHTHITMENGRQFQTNFAVYANREMLEAGKKSIDLRDIVEINSVGAPYALSTINHESSVPGQFDSWVLLFDAMAMKALESISTIKLEEMEPIGLITRAEQV